MNNSFSEGLFSLEVLITQVIINYSLLIDLSTLIHNYPQLIHIANVQIPLKRIAILRFALWKKSFP